MDIEFSEEGGYVDLATGTDATTTLEVFREDKEVRIELISRPSHGEIGLGVGLDAEQARRVGHQLIAHADGLDEEAEDSEE